MRYALAAPGTSVNETQLPVAVVVENAEVPDLEIVPLCKGFAIVGRTRMFPNVAMHPLLPPALTVLTVKVIADVVRDVNEMAKTVPAVEPLIVTVGAVPVVSHSNPAGAFK